MKRETKTNIFMRFTSHIYLDVYVFKDGRNNNIKKGINLFITFKCDLILIYQGGCTPYEIFNY